MELFKKFSEEIKAKISEQLKSKEFQDLLGKIKAAGEDSGSFEVVISTSDQDRQGDVVDQAGWDLTFYKMNPVVLWAHDYFSLPIGVCDSIEVKDGKLMAKGKFAPEAANPFAQQVRRLYDLGIVKTTSVGFIPKESDGQNIKSAELLEFSFVPVPANPYALSLRQVKEMALDMAMLKMKGLEILEIKADEPKEGDACTMDDGTEGMMVMEGDAMVCKPKKKADDDQAEDNTLIENIKKILTQCKTDCIAAIKDPKATEIISQCMDKCTNDIVAAIQADDDAEDTTEPDDSEDQGSGKGMKSGRVISQKNRDLITNSIIQMKESIAALEELLKATEPQGDDQKIQRSKSAGFDEINKTLDIYLENRRVLRSVEKTLSDSLETLNKKIREKSKK